MAWEKMRLYYDKIPPRLGDADCPYTTDTALWEQVALPLGCGQMGVCVFGYPDEERIQITENSLANPFLNMSAYGTPARYGLQSFADLYLTFGHCGVTEYSRELSLDDAVARVSYLCHGVRYTRTYFASHPAGVLVLRLEASKKQSLSFRMSAVIPCLGEYLIVPQDGCGRTGSACAEGDTITLGGRMSYYGIDYEGIWCVNAIGGTLSADGESITVQGADEAYLYFVAGTNYRMESRVFTEPDPKKKLSPYSHPHQALSFRITRAKEKGYDALLREHIADHNALFSRVHLSLGAFDAALKPVDTLLAEYKAGRESRYLEALLFAYGRYLLIACSRRGGLPANLQGVWSAYAASPWSGGYWHNINLQMNYWHAAKTNLAELFLAYSDYAEAYMPLARRIADKFVAENYPHRLAPAGENGWFIRTGAWPYTLDQSTVVGHSGPGTGAFTSLLFWDYYDYTRDKEYLARVTYPLLRDMSLFFTKTLEERDGCYLVTKSASPENMHNGKHYHTEGCAFDQQMVYENIRRTLEAAEILGIDEPLLHTLRHILPRLSPVLVGLDGQVKEYREEQHYGDIGEYEHRHISHLVGLYPGNIIHRGTPAWLDAACVTLAHRGDRSTGWALAHRLCLWARTGRGDRVMALVRAMLRERIMDNLWDSHPPFQIDGNFGYTAGVAEALLASDGDVIRLLPSLPDEWSDCAFEGLVVQGNFEVSCTARRGKAIRIAILSRVGGVCKLCTDNVATTVFTHNGKPVYPQDGLLAVNTAPGDLIVGALPRRCDRIK